MWERKSEMRSGTHLMEMTFLNMPSSRHCHISPHCLRVGPTVAEKSSVTWSTHSNYNKMMSTLKSIPFFSFSVCNVRLQWAIL